MKCAVLIVRRERFCDAIDQEQKMIGGYEEREGSRQQARGSFVEFFRALEIS